MKQLATFSASLSLILMVASSASAQFIDFEAIDGILPDGSTALDDLKITDQFSSLGVTFGIDANLDGIADLRKSPVLEAVGYSNKDPKSGFANAHLGQPDVPAPSFESRLGNFFLRGGELYRKKNKKNLNLLISYDSPTSGASGEIWDIDGSIYGTEQWRIEALGQDLSVIDYVLSPKGTTPLTLDAKPWLWAFDRDTEDISAIRFNFVGTKPGSNVGLAFDNFSVRSVENSEKVPEPTSVLSLLAFGTFGTMLLKRKQQKTTKELGIN
ncbi:MAG: PEP-CTERM sorting domain-containing protein [Oscillatoria sp. PMC 1051.18]|nr:PEP-CTERM sorting domain-containing protein [Oscillatoria sp. PMC 1050.18]MEC5030346.1 PEP-CTERM sorting domain-containing protein [Oscillatoria sp. PMC 1051.18]